MDECGFKFKCGYPFCGHDVACVGEVGHRNEASEHVGQCPDCDSLSLVSGNGDSRFFMGKAIAYWADEV